MVSPSKISWRMGKKKPRTPRGYRVQVEDRIIERSVIAPTRWEHRHRLVEVDARYGMNGAWVAAIDEVFDEAWLREQVDAAHHVARAMSWPYPYVILTLAEVADLVLGVRAAEAGVESLVKRLRVHEQYVGASFEARVARWLARARLPFRFASSTGPRAADIAVTGALPFGIEVKHVANAVRSNVEASLTDLVSSHIAFARSDVRHVRFEWTGSEVQQTPLVELNLARLHMLAERVVTLARERLQLARSGETLEVAVDGVGKVYVALDATYTRTSIGIEGHGDDECRNALRLVKQIHNAADQLDRSLAGVVVLGAIPDVLEADHAADHARQLLTSAGSEMDHVAGAIILGASAEWMTERTIPVPNPHARVPLGELPLPQAQGPTREARFEDFGDLFVWSE